MSSTIIFLILGLSLWATFLSLLINYKSNKDICAVCKQPVTNKAPYTYYDHIKKGCDK